MYGNNNCNFTPCNCNRSGFSDSWQAFWIIVIIAIIIIWVHCGVNGWGGQGCCCNHMNCGCDNDCNSCC